MAAGLQSIAVGGKDIARGFGEMVVDQNREAEHDLQKRLLDFKLQTEMELEDYKRTMPAGGTNYTASWQERYRERASEFVGEKDANIPAHMRGRVGVALKQHEVALAERAQREEIAERDRTRIEGLEQTLGVTRSRVEADPARLEEMRTEGGALIESALISPAAKDRLRKHYGKELDKTAIISRIMKAQTAEDFKALEVDLAPHKPDRGAPSSTSAIEFIKKQEGERDVGWDYRQYSGPYGVRRGKDERLTLPQAEARLKEEVSKVETEIDARLPGLLENQRAALTSLFYNMGTGKGRLEQVAKLIESGQADKVPAWIRQYNRNADGGFMEGLASRRSREAALFASGGGAASPTGDPDGYAGPYPNMTLADRKAFVSQIETQRRKLVGEVERVIKDQMGVAGEGYAPPAPIMAEIEKRVQAMGDPMLAAQYQTLMGKVGMTQQLERAPPQAAEEFARREREVAAEKGATKEQLEMIQHAEKVAASIKKQVNDNPLGHAQKVGLDVPLADGPPADADPSTPWTMPTQKVSLEQLNFAAPDIDGQLVRRMETAKGVARYYGQGVQAFTPVERDFLKDQLAKGGPVMLGVMGKIAAAAGAAGIEPEKIMKEFAKDAPEVAIVGEMVANNADPRILDTASKALAWKVGMGEKFSSTIDPALANAALGPMAEVLKSDPTKIDSVKALAAVVYEYEARAKGAGAEGKLKFSPRDYESVINRIMGETKDASGQTYGGIGEQGSGWFDGKSGTKVLVPAGVRSDSFDVLIGTIRNEDVPKLGVPQTGDGRPLTAAEMRRASWVSTGRGKYVLVLGEDADGTKRVASNSTGQPLEIDIRPLLPTMQKRRPDIFIGYNPMLDVIPPAPPAETGALYPRDPGPAAPEPTPPGQRRGTTGAMGRNMRGLN